MGTDNITLVDSQLLPPVSCVL